MNYELIVGVIQGAAILNVVEHSAGGPSINARHC